MNSMYLRTLIILWILEFTVATVSQSCTSDCGENASCVNGSCTCNIEFTRIGEDCEAVAEGDPCPPSDCNSMTMYCPPTEPDDGVPTCARRIDRLGLCQFITNECISPFTCVTGSICDCPYNTYYYLSDRICSPKLDWRTECDDNTQCQGNMTCRSDVCDCMDLQFYNGTHCKPMTELQVQDPVVSSRTEDSVSFTWTSNSLDSSVSYRVTGIPNTTSSTATASGCNVTGLVPGREYGLSVDSYFPADANIAERKTSVALTNVWTMPSKPGSFNLPLSQLSLNPMTFGFLPSNGDVSMYKINITTIGSFSTKVSVVNNTLEGLVLEKGMTYNYAIVAINGNDDESEKTIGTFKTNGVERIGFGPLHVGLFVCLGLIRPFLN